MRSTNIFWTVVYLQCAIYISIQDVTIVKTCIPYHSWQLIFLRLKILSFGFVTWYLAEFWDKSARYQVTNRKQSFLHFSGKSKVQWYRITFSEYKFDVSSRWCGFSWDVKFLHKRDQHIGHDLHGFLSHLVCMNMLHHIHTIAQLSHLVLNSINYICSIHNEIKRCRSFRNRRSSVLACTA